MSFTREKISVISISYTGAVINNYMYLVIYQMTLENLANILQLSWFLKVIYSFSTEGLCKSIYPEGSKAKHTCTIDCVP